MELDLVSCEPIHVSIGGDDSFWDVEVGLSSVTPPDGTLTATRTHDNGGVFRADFYVQPKFRFTRIDGPSTGACATGTEVTFDTGEWEWAPVLLGTGSDAPWVHEVGVGGPTESCGVKFAPGVEEDVGGVWQCCRTICHYGATANHCNIVGYDCSDCPKGACCYVGDGSCQVVSPDGAKTAKEVCENAGGEYKGDTTTCDDGDGDGIPDVREINDCCAPDEDLCNIRTNPARADTDGDGVPDWTEIKTGSDPCVARIPTVSEWGLIVMTVLVLTAGAMVLRRRAVLRS